MLSDSDTNAIVALHNEWLRRELAGEASTLIELCADGVTLIPPGQKPVVGRFAVSEWLARPGPEVLSVTADIRSLRGDGATAYKLAEFQSSFRDAAAGEALTVSGSHLWILERDDSGEWRVALLTWNLYD